MPFTDDPIADFHRHDARQQAWIDTLPRCSECDEPIQDDACFFVNDELICDGCMYKNHRKVVSV